MNEKLLPRAAVVLLAGAAFVIVMAGLRGLQDIVAPIFLALVLTITVHPMRPWLRRHGVPEWLASTIMLLVAYALIITLSIALVIAIGQLAELLPTYAPELKANLADIGDLLSDAGVGTDEVNSMVNSLDLSQLVSIAGSILSSVVGVLSGLLFIGLTLLFMAFDAIKTTSVLSALRDGHKDLIDAFRSFALGTRSYMVVSATFGLIVAVIDATALWLMGVPGAFIWGLLAFVTNFIPNIGFIIGLVPPALIGLLEGGPKLMLGVILVYCVINFIIQSVIQPRVVGDRVGLTPTITFLSVIFWTWAIGPLGALLAVPLSIFTRAMLVEADPAARWALPLITGKLDPPDDDGAVTAEQPSGA